MIPRIIVMIPRTIVHDSPFMYYFADRHSYSGKIKYRQNSAPLSKKIFRRQPSEQKKPYLYRNYKSPAGELRIFTLKNKTLWQREEN